jgi:hypothetical protein
VTSASPLSFNTSLPPRGGGSRARSLTTFQPKPHCCATSCQLFRLWYLLSIKTGVFFLVEFATGAAPLHLQDFWGLLHGIQFVMVPAAVDIGLLWLFTAIFLDHHVQRVWNTSKFGIYMSKRLRSFSEWGFCISVVVAASVVWELWYNYGFEDLNSSFLGNGMSVL